MASTAMMSFHSFKLGYSTHQRYSQAGCGFFNWFVLFLATLQHMEVPGQGLDPSHSCDLRWSLQPTVLGWGIKPASQRSGDTADAVAPQGELPLLLFFTSHFHVVSRPELACLLPHHLGTSHDLILIHHPMAPVVK